MKGLSTEQNVHKSTNIVHDLATLIVLTQPPDSLTLLIDPAHQKNILGRVWARSILVSSRYETF